MNACVFAFSTVPDIAGLRRLHRLPDALSDSEIAEYAFQRRRAEHVDDLLPPHLQRIAAFAVARIVDGRFSLYSSVETDERALITGFFESVVGAAEMAHWSEQEASLACLRTRALLNVVPLASLSVLNGATTSLGEWLSGCAQVADLASLARLAGIPLPRGFMHEAVWQIVLAGKLDLLRADTELRALSAFLLQMRHQYVIGASDQAELASIEAQVRQHLLHSFAAPHLREFEQNWRS